MNRKVVLVVAKCFDDIKVAGENDNAKLFVEKFNESFKFGSISCDLGAIHFFGISTVKNEALTTCTDDDYKLGALTEYALSRQRRKEPDEPLNELERSIFASTNSIPGCIGTAASPHCAFYASHLHPRAPHTHKCDLIEQRNIVRKLQKFGTAIGYPRPIDDASSELSGLTFAHASKSETYDELGVLAGLIAGDLAKNSIFNCLSRISLRSKKPVISVRAAEILASFEAIDESK